MNRIQFVSAFFGMFLFVACNQAQSTQSTESISDKVIVTSEGDTIQKVVKSEAEWKQELSEFEYFVLREAGTERAFSGAFWNNKEEGAYVCRACGFSLFSSGTKFKSGTGWPSFFKPANDYCIAEKKDNKYGRDRTEVLCSRCGGHLGHLFPDGPKPTGLRYCINSASLKFAKKE